MPRLLYLHNVNGGVSPSGKLQRLSHAKEEMLRRGKKPEAPQKWCGRKALKVNVKLSLCLTKHHAMKA
jgi:hypothetical protein